MGLISSIYAAVSGLQLNSQELSVVGDNIANVNTIVLNEDALFLKIPSLSGLLVRVLVKSATAPVHRPSKR